MAAGRLERGEPQARPGDPGPLGATWSTGESVQASRPLPCPTALASRPAAPSPAGRLATRTGMPRRSRNAFLAPGFPVSIGVDLTSANRPNRTVRKWQAGLTQGGAEIPLERVGKSSTLSTLIDTCVFKIAKSRTCRHRHRMNCIDTCIDTRSPRHRAGWECVACRGAGAWAASQLPLG